MKNSSMCIDMTKGRGDQREMKNPNMRNNNNEKAAEPKKFKEKKEWIKGRSGFICPTIQFGGSEWAKISSLSSKIIPPVSTTWELLPLQ